MTFTQCFSSVIILVLQICVSNFVVMFLLMIFALSGRSSLKFCVCVCVCCERLLNFCDVLKFILLCRLIINQTLFQVLWYFSSLYWKITFENICVCVKWEWFVEFLCCSSGVNNSLSTVHWSNYILTYWWWFQLLCHCVDCILIKCRCGDKCNQSDVLPDSLNQTLDFWMYISVNSLLTIYIWNFNRPKFCTHVYICNWL